MKKFKFSLEKLLDFRIAQEQQQKQHYATLQHSLAQAQYHYQLVLTEKNGLLVLPRGDVGRMQVQYRYLAELDRQLMIRHQEIQQKQQQVQQAQHEVVIARQARQVLEKLHDQQLANYRQEFQRVEQMELDDLATTRYKVH